MLGNNGVNTMLIDQLDFSGNVIGLAIFRGLIIAAKKLRKFKTRNGVFYSNEKTRENYKELLRSRSTSCCSHEPFEPTPFGLKIVIDDSLSNGVIVLHVKKDGDKTINVKGFNIAPWNNGE